MAKRPDKPEVLLDAAAGVNTLREDAKKLHDEGGRFVKGHKKRGGRAKGARNRVNADAKELMDQLVLYGLEHAEQWLEKSAKKSPSRALQVLARFAEYRLPKLARIENTGPNGGPQVIEKRVYVTGAPPDTVTKGDEDKE